MTQDSTLYVVFSPRRPSDQLCFFSLLPKRRSFVYTYAFKTVLPGIYCKFYVVNNKPEYFHYFTLNNTVRIIILTWHSDGHRGACCGQSSSLGRANKSRGSLSFAVVLKVFVSVFISSRFVLRLLWRKFEMNVPESKNNF